MIKITSFKGIYHFLSNFYLCDIELNGKIYPSLEHAFQATKTHCLADRESIRNASTPAYAKRLGLKVVLRADWEAVKLSIMKRLVSNKFALNKELADLLRQTGDAELIEGNNWGDAFWGVCGGVGRNHLGKILMEVREEIRNG